jgi:hypothetical protein
MLRIKNYIMRTTGLRCSSRSPKHYNVLYAILKIFGITTTRLHKRNSPWTVLLLALISFARQT